MLAFIYPAKASEVHLVRAVEDHHVLSQTAAHVFGRLRLSGSSWTCWCSTHTHP